MLTLEQGERLKFEGGGLKLEHRGRGELKPEQGGMIALEQGGKLKFEGEGGKTRTKRSTETLTVRNTSTRT